MKKIESNIPMPPPPTHGPAPKYPELREMSVGDSVMYEGFYTYASNSKPAIAARVYGSRSGKQFKTRKVEGGVRIWRVK